MGENDRQIVGTVPQRIKSCLNVLDGFLQSDQIILSCHVKDLNSNRLNLDKKVDLISKICDILGVKDYTRLCRNTLTDLGMDSLMATEIIIML